MALGSFMQPGCRSLGGGEPSLRALRPSDGKVAGEIDPQLLLGIVVQRFPREGFVLAETLGDRTPESGTMVWLRGDDASEGIQGEVETAQGSRHFVVRSRSIEGIRAGDEVLAERFGETEAPEIRGVVKSDHSTRSDSGFNER